VLKNIRNVFCGDEFVAGRVGGIDANQTLSQIKGFTFKLGEIGRLRRSGWGVCG
jgi:hypothetical protein